MSLIPSRPVTADALIAEVSVGYTRGLVMAPRYGWARGIAVPQFLDLLRGTPLTVKEFSSTFMELRLTNGAVVQFVWEAADTTYRFMHLDWAWLLYPSSHEAELDASLSPGNGRLYKGLL